MWYHFEVVLSYFVFKFHLISDSKEYKFPGGIIQLAQYWKNKNELRHSENIFSEFLNQVIEKDILMIITMDEM